MTGLLSMFMSIGPVLFVALVLAHCFLRYGLKPAIRSPISLRRPWIVPVYVSLAVVLVVFPAIFEMTLRPSFEPIFQSSFGPLHEFFQWFGALSLLFIVLMEDLGGLREERRIDTAETDR